MIFISSEKAYAFFN